MPKELPENPDIIEQFRVRGLATRNGMQPFTTQIRSRRSEAQAELERLRGYEHNSGLHIERRIIAMGAWEPSDD